MPSPNPGVQAIQPGYGPGRNTTMEIFRFGFYVFFPVYVMFKVGDPEWYEKHVIPYKEMIWPDKDEYKPPRTQADMKAELARFRAERAERKARLEGGSAPTTDAAVGGNPVGEAAAAAKATPVADAVATSSTGWSYRASRSPSSGTPTERLV